MFDIDAQTQAAIGAVALTVLILVLVYLLARKDAKGIAEAVEQRDATEARLTELADEAGYVAKQIARMNNQIADLHAAEAKRQSAALARRVARAKAAGAAKPGAKKTSRK